MENKQRTTKQLTGQKIKKEVKTYLKTNENNTIFQNLEDTAKAVLRGKFIVI